MQVQTWQAAPMSEWFVTAKTRFRNYDRFRLLGQLEET